MKKRISSKTTFFYKRIFPVLLFMAPLLLMAGAFIALILHRPFPLETLIIALLIAGLAYLAAKKILFKLTDEVWDDGDALIVRQGEKENRILFSNIAAVKYARSAQPPRVKLSLRSTEDFGDEISFIPPLRFLPGSSPVVVDLIQRINAVNQF